MTGGLRSLLSRDPAGWIGWCCPYCAGPLAIERHGVVCHGEERWFATDRGVHRLLSEERRPEIQPYLELYQRVRRDEGWRAEPTLPDVPPDHPHAAVWKLRAAHFRHAIDLAAAVLGGPPWRVLEVGAGNCWASVRLLELGHQVAAVDVNMDPEDGLLAAEQLLAEGMVLPRAEAEMEALPFEPGLFDLVLAAGALHHATHLTRTLVELRRVTRRGGVLLVVDSPVYRRRADGETMVADRMRDHAGKYGVSVPREAQSGYLVAGEIERTFGTAGWQVEIHGGRGRLREWARDVRDLLRHHRRTARFPVLLARREG